MNKRTNLGSTQNKFPLSQIFHKLGNNRWISPKNNLKIESNLPKVKPKFLPRNAKNKHNHAFTQLLSSLIT